VLGLLATPSLQQHYHSSPNSSSSSNNSSSLLQAVGQPANGGQRLLQPAQAQTVRVQVQPTKHAGRLQLAQRLQQQQLLQGLESHHLLRRRQQLLVQLPASCLTSWLWEWTTS
jgi:hypothetical protein